MTDEVKTNGVHLTKHDRVSVWWRSFFLQGSWNYERMQNLGWAFSMVPVIKRLYPDKEDRAAALQRHMEFFNTHPYVASPILGVQMAMEEQRANGGDIDDEAINGVKVGMMGPLAGVGDPVWWGTVRPVLGAFAASLALTGNIMGPIIFFVVWNVLRMLFLWYTQELGYRSGTNITQDLAGGAMQKITTGASILGMFIMGVLVPRWTTMNFPLIISKVKVSKDAQVDLKPITQGVANGHISADKLISFVQQVQGGKLNLGAYKVTTLQDTLNTLIPGLMPLLLLMLVLYLLRKKVSPLWIIFGLFVLGIVGYWIGLMG